MFDQQTPPQPTSWTARLWSSMFGRWTRGQVVGCFAFIGFMVVWLIVMYARFVGGA